MITINLTISLDASDLTATIDKLAAIGRGVALLASTGNEMNRINGIDNSHSSYSSPDPIPPEATKRPQKPQNRAASPQSTRAPCCARNSAHPCGHGRG